MRKFTLEKAARRKASRRARVGALAAVLLCGGALLAASQGLAAGALAGDGGGSGAADASEIAEGGG